MSQSFNDKIVRDFQKSFENLCLSLLHEGYGFMQSDNRYRTNWSEENLTAYLYWCLKQLESRLDNQISVHCEVRQYDEKHFFEGFTAKSAPRIDMELSKWYSTFEIVFQVEAKILFETDKITTKGNNVSATKGHKRYIETGIDHFQTGYYPMPGCMVGYVVEGDVANIIDSINAIIAASNKGKITRSLSSDFSAMHLSSITTENGVVDLRHFMLKL